MSARGDENAFPVRWTNGEGTYYGLTKREWFAGQALAGLMANGIQADMTWGDIAKSCIAHADALLDALDRKAAT